MKTEIDTLKTAWRDYANAKSIEEFNAAEKVLLKFAILILNLLRKFAL